ARRARARSQSDPRVQADGAQLPSRSAAPRGAATARHRRARPAAVAQRDRPREAAGAAARFGDRSLDAPRARAWLPRRSGSRARAAGAGRSLMRLVRLRLCNFRQHIDTRIEFDSGITGIIGPNGSGKSTILEAIAWALYSMPAARGTRDSIRSYRAAERAAVKVELEFELSGHHYRVARGLTSADLYLDGASAPIATSITGVSDLLRRRLGMSHDEFFNTYFTGQKELSVMAAMGPAERAQFLSRVLGYERLRTAQGLVRERRKVIVAEASGLRSAMPDPDVVNRSLADAERRLADATARSAQSDARRVAARATLDALTPKWEAQQRERDTLQALGAELRVVDGERAAAERDAARLERELEEAARARSEVERLSAELGPFTGLQAELRELEKSCNEDRRRQTLADTERSLREELGRLRERLGKVDTAPALEVE